MRSYTGLELHIQETDNNYAIRQVIYDWLELQAITKNQIQCEMLNLDIMYARQAKTTRVNNPYPQQSKSKYIRKDNSFDQRSKNEVPITNFMTVRRLSSFVSPLISLTITGQHHARRPPPDQVIPKRDCRKDQYDDNSI